MRRPLPFVAGITAILLLVPSNVTGYGVALHDLFPLRALAESRAPSGRAVRADTLAGVTDADIARFRGWFYERAWQITQLTSGVKEISVTATVKSAVGNALVPRSTVVALKSSRF